MTRSSATPVHVVYRVWYSVKTLVVADQVDVAGRFLEDRKLQMTDRESRLLDHELANFVT